MSDQVAMPGDPDQEKDKTEAALRTRRGGLRKDASKDEKPASGQDVKGVSKDEAVKTSQELDEAKAVAGVDRGELSPAQHDDDGWGDTPVQMRGK